MPRRGWGCLIFAAGPFDNIPLCEKIREKSQSLNASEHYWVCEHPKLGGIFTKFT